MIAGVRWPWRQKRKNVAKKIVEPFAMVGMRAIVDDLIQVCEICSLVVEICSHETRKGYFVPGFRVEDCPRSRNPKRRSRLAGVKLINEVVISSVESSLSQHGRLKQPIQILCIRHFAFPEPNFSDDNTCESRSGDIPSETFDAVMYRTNTSL